MNSSILIQLSTEELEALIHRVLDAHSNSKESSSIPPSVPIDEQTLCSRLGISRQTAKTWRQKKKIPFFMVGGSIRYDWTKVMGFLEKKSGK